MNEPIQLLDCTLRDGSYAIDFQFTAQDTRLIASALEQAGIRCIEVGHGLGLGASEKGHGESIESDEAYCKAASEVLTQAQWGTFFIPGLGTMADLDMLASYGANFVRIGADVTRTEEAVPFIQHAKELGLTVFSNFMKTYAVSPKEFATYAAISVDAGADVLVVVDSAGGMFPEDVARYTAVLKESLDVAVGFHGHNNLDLVTANALAAMEAGATVIDTSLQGMGRSAGNAITEVLALILKKKAAPGHEVLDPNKLMDIGDKFIKPLLREDKFTGLSMTSGYAQFHSSFTGVVLEYARRYHVDPRELIVRLTQESQVNAPDELVESLAQQLATEKSQIQTHAIVLSDPYVDDAAGMIKTAQAWATKQNKQLIYNLVYSETQSITLSQNVQQNDAFILLNGQGKTMAEFEATMALFQHHGSDTLYLIDKPLMPEQTQNVMTYDDAALWASAIIADLNETAEGQRVVMVGEHPIRQRVVEQSALWLFDCVTQPEEATVLVSFDSASVQVLPSLLSIDIYYDAVIGGFKNCLNDLQGKLIFRVDMAPTLFAHIQTRLAYRHIASRRGRQEREGFSFVSGGVIGQAGDIVVDDYRQPKTVIGVANGMGGLEQHPEEHQDTLSAVQSYIAGLGL